MARIAHCRVGADRFAIELDALSGVERTDRLQLAPREAGGGRAAAIGWLLGSAQEDVPVWSLARLLGRPGAEETVRGAGVVLLGSGPSGAGRYGVLVDGIERSERSAEAIHPLPKPFLRAGLSGFRGVVQAGEELSLLVDLGRWVHGEERQADRKEALDLEAEQGRTAFRAPVAPVAAGGRRASRVLIADLLVRSAEGRRVSVAFAAGQVAEVIEAPPVLSVPGAPSRMPGMILWRDLPLPVLDLAGYVPGPGRPSAVDRPADRFVIATTGREQVAVPVGRDVRFERLPLAARPVVRTVEEAGPEILGGYDLPESLLLVFDLARSLASSNLA